MKEWRLSPPFFPVGQERMKILLLLPLVGTAIMVLLPTTLKSRVREVALLISIVTLLETVRLYMIMDKSVAGFQHMFELR